MKILWVKPGKLLPLDTGGKLRTYNILRHLSGTQDVTYLSYYGGSRDQKYEREILQRVPHTVTVHTPAPDSNGFERYLDYVLRLPSRAPYSVSKFTTPQVQEMLHDWISQRRFDVAVCDFMASTLNFPRELAPPRSSFSTMWRHSCGNGGRSLR